MSNFIYNKTRLTQILSVIMTIILLLSIRIFILMVYPTKQVQSSYQNHQEEKITNMSYSILDANNKDLIKYDKKYVLVIDARPFSLNNYEETIQDLMAFNFIMKEEDEKFNYSDIMKANGKSYYYISEETYNKINKLTNIKGIYTYTVNEADLKEAWSVPGMFSKLNTESYKEGSLEDTLYQYIKDNEVPKQEFYLDEKTVYSSEVTNINDNNKNIKLTIDSDMQDKVREIFEDDKYSYLNNVGVTIMESDTGKIKVLAQKNESEPNINLGMQQIGYEPGSIYKVITLASALDRGLTNINDVYKCSGKICKRVHGSLSLEVAFEKSCNDILAQVGNKVGYESLMKYSKELGLYSPVLNLNSENSTEASGMQPKEDDGMNNIAIGQCMNVTPVQMIGAINTVINNGIYIKPYIVDSIVDKDNNTIKVFSSTEKKIYSETTSKLLKNAMRKVVTQGTGKKAYISGLDIGGKTGSSTGSNKTTHGWFAGFFEYNNKTYTMIVFTPQIEEIKGDDNEDYGGGDTAAPIFKDIVNILNK